MSSSLRSAMAAAGPDRVSQVRHLLLRAVDAAVADGNRAAAIVYLHLGLELRSPADGASTSLVAVAAASPAAVRSVFDELMATAGDVDDGLVHAVAAEIGSALWASEEIQRQGRRDLEAAATVAEMWPGL